MVNESTSSSNENSAYRTPNNIIGKQAFQLLCIIALSRTNLEHWDDMEGEGWEKHIKVTAKRFKYSNITVSLIPFSVYE
jgi:hypothetical protein